MSFEQHQTLFTTSTRYGVPIERCKIIEIGKNLIGSTKPSKVIIEITYDLNKFLDAGLRDEWDSFRMDNIVSLQSIKSKPQIYTTESELKVDHLTGRELAQVLGLESVRGGQIVGLVGDDGKLMNHFDLNIIQSIIEAVKKLPPDQLNKYKKEAMLKIISDSGFSKGIFGSKRSLRISMGVNTYAGDTLDYTMFNYLIRKEPKLNGCKNVSEGMKEMLLKSSGVNSGTFLPDFVRDQWLGTGKMGEADYLNSKHVNRQFIMHNVFQNDAHLTECFDCNIEFRGVREFTGSYIISFPRSMFLNLETEEMSSELQEVCISNKLDLKNDDKEGCIIVRDCPFVYNGPFVDAPVPMIQTNKLNKQQVNAIHAGLSHGLTVINGAFGTGKTEVASTIIQNLLSNFSEQRILLVSAHQKSVDTIFDKVIQQSSIDARYLVRVGFDGGDSYFSTEELLETDRYGRLQLFTSKRADLLDKVDKLAASLDCLGAYGNSCETATYFNETHVVTKWHTFHFRVINEFEKTSQVIREHFPFSRYFDTTNSNQLFPKDSSYETSLTIAEGCFRYLKTLFKQLEDMRAFEILRTDVDRANYLVVKEAKLIAMTCSFASLKRNQLSQLGFTFDTIIYEDANLSNEIESLMSIQLQTTNSGQSRLKRIILLGNDQGLLFSSKHAALDTTNLEQSLFKRFIRLGVPGIVLDGPLRFQRDFMVQLLSNKSNQIPNPKTLANPGFCFDSQFINVPTFMKMNEHTPQVGHYQNIGEAEYSVATFMYMRLMGYQSNDISILTTYKGQRDLIIDVLNRRCSSNPIFGKPRDVSHVDSYVGLENKYVIVSLVRTTNDINPLNERNVKFILSRASIGLYVFGRIKCLEKVDGCEDMCRVFKTRPTDLCILLKESFDTCSRRYDQTGVKIRADGSSQANATQTRIVKGVEEFGKIVYNLTEEHLKNMRK